MTFLTTSTTPRRAGFLGAEHAASTGRKLVAYVQQIWRSYHNRRAIGRLMALDAHELGDIGLTRSDVAGALALPLSHDPSAHLAARLVEQRRIARLNRLCR